jgi:hypothetical protein
VGKKRDDRAVAEGRCAYEMDEAFSSCPHPSYTHKARDWQFGWMEGKEAAEEFFRKQNNPTVEERVEKLEQQVLELSSILEGFKEILTGER